jgi:predicted esterase
MRQSSAIANTIAGFMVIGIAMLAVVTDQKTSAAPSSVCIRLTSTRSVKSNAQARVILWSGTQADASTNVQIFDGQQAAGGMQILITNPQVLSTIGSLSQLHAYIHVPGYQANRITLSAPFETCTTTRLFFGAFDQAEGIDVSDLLRGLRHLRGQEDSLIAAIVSTPYMLADLIHSIRNRNEPNVFPPVLSIVASSSSSSANVASSSSSSSKSSSQSSASSSSSRSVSSASSGATPFADMREFTMSCTGHPSLTGINYYVQIPQQRPVLANIPMYIMFHEAGADTTYIDLWTSKTDASVIKLRKVMNDNNWIYVVPYHYSWWNYQVSDANAETCYTNMIENIKKTLRDEYGAIATTNPVYLGGASLGGNRALRLTKRNPSRYSGLTLMYSAIDYSNNSYSDSFFGDYQSSQYPMPVFMWTGLGEGRLARAMTRLYNYLQQTSNTVRMIASNTGGHSPANFPSDVMMDFFKAGNTHVAQLDQWSSSTDKRTLAPYSMRTAANDVEAFYSPEAKQHNYTYTTSDIFPYKPSDGKYRWYATEPILISGLPPQEATKKRVMYAFREDDNNSYALGYGHYSDGLNGAYWQEYEYGTFWSSFGRNLSARGWLWVTPASFEYNQFSNEVTSAYPSFTGGNYGMGVGYGAKRLAQMHMERPNFYKGLILIEPAFDTAYAETLASTIPATTPVVISVRKTDTSANGSGARQLYALLKSQNKTVMLMEKDLPVETKRRGLSMHSGRYEIDFILLTPTSGYRRVDVTYSSSYNVNYSIQERGNGG